MNSCSFIFFVNLQYISDYYNEHSLVLWWSMLTGTIKAQTYFTTLNASVYSIGQSASLLQLEHHVTGMLQACWLANAGR